MQYENKKALQLFAFKLKRLRENHKLKLETLSYRIGIAPSTLYRIESGKTDPKYLTLRKIASAFNLTIAEFFNEIEKR